MKFFAYLTPSCIENAQRHSVEDAVRRLAQKVERDQAISSWDKFLPTPYIKKSLGRDWRIVAEKRPITGQDIIVICLIAVLSRGGHEYKNFMDDPSAFGATLLPSDHEILQFVNEKSKQPLNVLPPPSMTEYSYLYGQQNGIDTSYGVVYESKDWVKLIARIDTQLAWYYDLVAQAVNPDNADNTVLSKNNLLIIYRYFLDSNSVFLIAPIREHELELREDIERRYKHILELGNNYASQDLPNFNNIGDLLKVSGRAYPTLITADSDIWLKIQKNTEANLALSSEESAILDSVTHPSSIDEKIYPLFINGRPGSGKSTILQYLFAEHLHSHLSKPIDEKLPFPPLYLTYSEKLLQWAKTVVKSLLHCNSKLAIQGSTFTEEEVRIVFEECFAEFHKFLYKLLAVEERINFDPAKRIDFTEFRRRWNNKIKSNPDAELRNLSPELVWHVIRTYIKGMRDDENNYLDLDAYAELPNKQRTVGNTTYRKIFERVWDGWYKPLCENEGFWDDQDITRRLLNFENIKLSNHPVVFCDEAQDFTKIELEMILRLSLFSNRTLRYEDLKRVPFAFAGDPFQTLNPTGFDWASVQAGFHEKIVQELDKSSRSNLEFNYQELSFNYRSTKYIVRFCNLIQILRGVLFGVKYLKPQRTWFDEEAPLPVYFDIAHETCQEKIREQSEIVIILPCQEGEETDFIEKDEFLSQLAKDDVRNFLSPMSAKGLEFSRIVLYKFGNDYCQNYPQLLDPLKTGCSHGDSPEEALPLEYFINRLYVAASRPKRRLFIVDTKDGIERFWNSDFLKKPVELLKLYPSSNANGWEAEDLTFIQPGQEENWFEDRDNPLKLAKQFLEEGIAKKDPYKLRLAEANFKRAGKSYEERNARALRLEIEGNYLGAAREYLELDDLKKSLRLFWKAKAYKEIYINNSFANTIEHHAASFEQMSKSLASCQSFLDLLYNEITGANLANIFEDKQWLELGHSLIRELSKLTDDDIRWAQIYSKIEKMISEGFELHRTKELAEIAFRAGRYQDAIEIWDADPGLVNKTLSYKEAKSRTEHFPKNIKWLVELGKYENALEVYEENSDGDVPSEFVDNILEAHTKLQRYREALSFLSRHPKDESLEKLYNELKRGNRESLILESAILLLKIRLRTANWGKAIDLIEKEKWGEDKKAPLRVVLLAELAKSDALVEDSVENKNFVADYLKKQIGQFSTNLKISHGVIGAAVERAGRIVDALAFYESIWKSPKYEKSPEGMFARERWVKCKYRQADYSQTQGKEGDAYRQKRDADRFAEQWKMNAESIPNFPTIEIQAEQPSGIESSIQVNLSDEQIEAIKDLLKSNWQPHKIAGALRIPLDEVEKVKLPQ